VTKISTHTSENKRQINSDDKSAIMTIAVGMILLGAFFAINPSSLNVFADVEPTMLNFTSANDKGPIHPGEVFPQFKNVTMNTTIAPFFNVTWTVFNEGTSEICDDLENPNVPVLNFTALNQTKLLNSGNHSKFLLFTETFVGMPGVYHCTVVFEAVNATDSENRDFLGNQTVWIDAIGSQGFWKNHPGATAVHLPILLGNQTLDGGMNNVTTSENVTTGEEATLIFKEHKGKFDLDKLAAQLLAAKLNIWALNMTGEVPNDRIDCIEGNVTDADTYLAIAGYEGIGTADLKKKDKGAKATALGFHSALDRFNNSGCPIFPPTE